MATEITYVRTDSLDPRIGSDVEDVVFYNPLTGEKLEIQLGAANRKHFANHLDKLKKYIDAAVVVAEPVVETKPKATAKNSENAKMRAWAKENGFSIGDRGRISVEIQEAYKAAHEVIEPEQSDAEVVSDLQLDEVLEKASKELTETLDELIDVEVKLDELKAEIAAEQATETASTEEEIMAAYEAGHITPQAVMELLDEVDGNSEQE